MKVNCLISFYTFELTRSETDCTLHCVTEDECLAAHYQKTEGICQMGELKYRIDLAKGVGIPVKVAKGHLPKKGMLRNVFQL